MRPARAIAAAALVIVACNGKGDTRTLVPKVVAPAAPAANATEPARARAGVPHQGLIDLLALAADGRAALTRDSAGGVRFWSALDGTAEPQAVGVRGARAMSLAAHADGWTLALVDAAQAGVILRAHAGGGPGDAIDELAALPPFDPLRELHALPGGTRVLALAADSTLRIYDDAGVELARLEQRGFRPERLFVAADGTGALAATLTRDETGKTTGTLRRVRIDPSPRAGLALVGDEVSFETLLDPAAPALAASPDGKRFAVFSRNATGQTTEWVITVIDLATGVDRTVASPIALHLDPNLGFVGDQQLLAYTSRGATAWTIDLTADEARPVARSAPVQHAGGITSQAYARGAFAVGFGPWLYVQDIDARKERYLGYDPLQPMLTALSPSGERAVWASTMNQIFVESVADGSLVELPQDWSMHIGVQLVRFADEDHVIAVDRMGGIRLIDWRRNEVVAEAGASGGVRDADFDPATGLLVVTRHQNDHWFYELSKRELAGPYIVSDTSFRVGLLAAEKPADPVAYTLDTQGIYRGYTLAQLRGDEAYDPKQNGTPANAGGMPPSAIGRDGARYYLGATNVGGASVRRVDGADEREIPLSRANAALILPSPDGKRVLVTFHDGAILAYSTRTLQQTWSFSASTGTSQLQWSADGKRLAIVAGAGGAILAADDGKLVSTRCAQAFEVRATPPQHFFPTFTGPSLCER